MEGPQNPPVPPSRTDHGLLRPIERVHDEARALPPQPTRKLGIGDIYYVLFKHKWMILGFGVFGIATTAAAYRI